MVDFFLIEKNFGRNLKCQINLPKYVDLNIVQSFKSYYFQNAHWHLKISLNLHYLFYLSLSCIWLPLWGFLRVPFILIVVEGNDDNILIRLSFNFIIIAVFVLAVFFFIRCTFGLLSVCLRRCV